MCRSRRHRFLLSQYDFSKNRWYRSALTPLSEQWETDSGYHTCLILLYPAFSKSRSYRSALTPLLMFWRRVFWWMGCLFLQRTLCLCPTHCPYKLLKWTRMSTQARLCCHSDSCWSDDGSAVNSLSSLTLQIWQMISQQGCWGFFHTKTKVMWISFYILSPELVICI